MRRSTFITGFIIATLLALIVWYYQKSTSTEDGALELLDRYAAALKENQRFKTGD